MEQTFYTYQQYRESADALAEKLGAFRPEVLMILGSGLGSLGDRVEDPIVVPYGAVPHSPAGLRDWLARLSLDGRRSVVITGVRREEGSIGAGCFDRASGTFSFPQTREEARQFPGTGDLFASVLLGGLLRGMGLDAAAQQAVDFVQQCAARTIALDTPTLDGVEFEGLLGRLAAE